METAYKKQIDLSGETELEIRTRPDAAIRRLIILFVGVERGNDAREPSVWDC